MTRPYRVLDVFAGATGQSGNPLAVLLDAEGLQAASMQRFAAWTNLSETTFVHAPSPAAAAAGAHYRVRIFTPSIELPFAGHPTLGSCAAWLDAGGRPTGEVIIQECGIGLVPVRRTVAGLAFAAPRPLRSGPVESALAARLTRILGIRSQDVVDAQWADNGPGWVAVLLDSADDVLRVRPTDLEGLKVGVVGPHPPGSPWAWEIRAFCPGAGGVVEDPATGSLNATVAQWLLATGRAHAPYIARQGTRLGRTGEIQVTQDDDGAVWVGGRASVCVTGTAQIE
jgi:PhzF family phenazine biosynthesis protein